jgi:hypothetical protein
MGGAGFDGMYGAAATWFAQEDLDAAEETVTKLARRERPSADVSIPDIDDYRR